MADFSPRRNFPFYLIFSYFQFSQLICSAIKAPTQNMQCTNQGDPVAAMHQTNFVDHSQVTATSASHACFGDKQQNDHFCLQAAQVYDLGKQENNFSLLSKASILEFETLFKQPQI